MSRQAVWNPTLEALPLSGIRRMFNLAATMSDVIHLSIGQPDFPTPAPIVEAHVTAVGLGVQDTTIAKSIFDQAVAKNLGVRIDFC
jgi:aspartate/methionine/tyrosine aminotransferase